MKGILFTPDNLLATIKGDKTQTRRIAKLKLKSGTHKKSEILRFARFKKNDKVFIKEPYKVVGFKIKKKGGWMTIIKYKDGQVCCFDVGDKKIKVSRNPNNIRWANKMFMPEKYARFYIQIKTVKYERLHDISTRDAIAEGLDWRIFMGHKLYRNYCSKKEVGRYYFMNPIESYKTLWESINGKYSWDDNPLVFVYKYKLLSDDEV